MTNSVLSMRINELQRLNEAIKQLQSEQKKIKALVIKGMKDNDYTEYTTGDNHTAKLESYIRTQLDTAKLKEHDPRTYQKYSYENEVTRLTVK